MVVHYIKSQPLHALTLAWSECSPDDNPLVVLLPTQPQLAMRTWQLTTYIHSKSSRHSRQFRPYSTLPLAGLFLLQPKHHTQQWLRDSFTSVQTPTKSKNVKLLVKLLQSQIPAMSHLDLRKFVATLVRENGQRDAVIGKLEERIGMLESENEMK